MSMSVEEIDNEWSKDSNLDQSNLLHVSMSVAKLHNKYYGYLVREQRQHLQLTITKEKLEVVLESYFSKTMTDFERQEYDLPPFPDRRYLKEDIKRAINNYKDMREINTQILASSYKIDYLKDIIKMIHNMSYQIRNTIEYLKYSRGEG